MAERHPFLDSPTGGAWKRLGTARRAGILAPLFSIQSKDSVGVGEFRDLEKLADWCRACGMSLIQLLPLNDVGMRFCPYDAESSFALEPMHIALDDLAGVAAKKYASDIQALRKRYPPRTHFFDTAVKGEKLRLLRRMFSERSEKQPKEFKRFREEQVYWLSAYALFKVLKQDNGSRAWEEWPAALRDRQTGALRASAEKHAQELLFHEWLQWQLFRQFSGSAARVRKKKVSLLGDLPFLVARDSADVWAHPEYFKLGLSAGAPPDLYFADGQEWGMPPYNWPALEAGGYDYLKEKSRFAAHFYDLYRLDHFVGLFRVWVFPREGGVDRKKQAAFDPSDGQLWEAQARQILGALLKATTLLPCAEDLGTVPDQARELLKEYAIPGMDVQRWMRDWDGTGEFLPPERYRQAAIVTLSTHDMTSFAGWWKTEATAEDKERFLRFLGLAGDAGAAPTLQGLLAAALEKAHASASIFSIHSFQDWMMFLGEFGEKEGDLRINRPGIVDKDNWRLRIPRFLEDLSASAVNKRIAEMNLRTQRR